MTTAANARIAGVTFLIYIAAGIASLVLMQGASGGGDIAAKLATMAANLNTLRIVALLDLLSGFCALTLAVTLYAITSSQEVHVALLAMVFRLVEGILVVSGVSGSLGLLWLASINGEDAGAAHLLGAYLMRNEVALTSTFFAAGSLLFSYLLLRGRMIPAPLAWLGLFASALLVLMLPPQLAGFLTGGMLSLAWLPMLAFEVPLALWLIFKGVRTPAKLAG
jgi:hypothetical protein